MVVVDVAIVVVVDVVVDFVALIIVLFSSLLDTLDGQPPSAQLPFRLKRSREF